MISINIQIVIKFIGSEGKQELDYQSTYSSGSNQEQVNHHRNCHHLNYNFMFNGSDFMSQSNCC